MKLITGLSALAWGCSLLAGCGGTTAGNPTINTSATEIAASTLNGAANSTEPNGTLASFRVVPFQSAYTKLENFLNPLSSCYASAACPLIANSSCSGTSIVLTYSNCGFGASPTLWNGSQTLAFSSSCASITLSGLANQTLTRTFGVGTTEATASGIVTSIDTAGAASSGWNSGIIVAGGGESAAFGACTDSVNCTRTLTIGGIHLRATFSGVSLYDHTISSNAITVTGAGINRSISSGTVTVQHNLAKYTAVAQITAPLIYSRASCCHPVSGAITSTLSGSVKGSETLVFTGAATGICGSANLILNDGTSSALSLSHCF